MMRELNMRKGMELGDQRSGGWFLLDALASWGQPNLRAWIRIIQHKIRNFFFG